MGTPQWVILSVIFFLVAISGILEELGNGVNGSLLTDDLVIYITTRNQRVTTRALQGVTNKFDKWAAKRGLIFSPNKAGGI